MWPNLAVQLITYNRPDEIRRVLEGLRTYLRYEGQVIWCLCDDGSPQGYVQSILADYPDRPWLVSRTKRKGWGGNVNAGLRRLAEEGFNYTFFIEDDYVPLGPLEITWGVALMESKPEIGLVRYDGLAGHCLDLELREARTAEFGMLAYLRISKGTPYFSTYSNRPHLKHRRFHGFYGQYPQGLALAATETLFAGTVTDRADGPWLVVLEDGIPRKFDHIGKSWQGSASDMEVVR